MNRLTAGKSIRNVVYKTHNVIDMVLNTFFKFSFVLSL